MGAVLATLYEGQVSQGVGSKFQAGGRASAKPLRKLGKELGECGWHRVRSRGREHTWGLEAGVVGS